MEPFNLYIGLVILVGILYITRAAYAGRKYGLPADWWVGCVLFIPLVASIVLLLAWLMQEGG
jgi:hypothetical protein